MFKKLITVILFLPALVFASEFVSGKDYQIIAENPNERPSIPKVIEFFSYGCPWCYRIEQSMNEWLKNEGEHINFERIPVVFNKDWELYAKAFYTAKALSELDQLSPLLFKAIQVEKKPLNTPQKMIDFFVDQGVDKETAESAFKHSTSIDLKVKNGMRLMSTYQVNAVPAFVVNEHYKTDLQMAKSPERLLKVLDFLIHKTDKNH